MGLTSINGQLSTTSCHPHNQDSLPLFNLEIFGETKNWSQKSAIKKFAVLMTLLIIVVMDIQISVNLFFVFVFGPKEQLEIMVMVVLTYSDAQVSATVLFLFVNSWVSVV